MKAIRVIRIVLGYPFIVVGIAIHWIGMAIAFGPRAATMVMDSVCDNTLGAWQIQRILDNIERSTMYETRDRLLKEERQ